MVVLPAAAPQRMPGLASAGLPPVHPEKTAGRLEDELRDPAERREGNRSRIQDAASQASHASPELRQGDAGPSPFPRPADLPGCAAADPAPEGVLDLFSTPPQTLAALARPSRIEHLSHVCAQTALATLERRSANQPGLGLALSQALARHSGQHDYVLLDCPPTLGLLMINALAAADRVVIPTQAEPLALHGLAGMRRTAEMV